MKPLPDICLLACDLDGTMFPTGPDATHAAALGGFAELRSRAGLSVAYVTGRHLASALEAMAHWSLPAPDLLSCDVGTSVYRPDAASRDGWCEDMAHAAGMREAMGGLVGADILDLLADVPGLARQVSVLGFLELPFRDGVLLAQPTRPLIIPLGLGQCQARRRPAIALQRWRDPRDHVPATDPAPGSARSAASATCTMAWSCGPDPNDWQARTKRACLPPGGEST